jgi:hypothetical protein
MEASTAAVLRLARIAQQLAGGSKGGNRDGDELTDGKSGTVDQEFSLLSLIDGT